jgi:hypothetical protein
MEVTTELVHRLRSAVVGELACDQREVARLAQEYNSACEDALQRLEEVCRCLSRGERSQAIYLAETHPPILEVIGALDFPGIEQWRALVGQNGLSAPPEFPVTKIREIEEAYVQQDALEPLEKKYRRLCLKNAPSSEKISVLRRIRAVDRGNPAWREDLAILETHRFREVQDRFANHSDEVGEDEARAVLAELTDARLVSKPTQDLVDAVAALQRSRKTVRVHETMKATVEEINAAYGALDYAGVCRGLGDIDNMAREEEVAVPDTLVEALEDARRWRNEQHAARVKDAAFERDLQALTDMLENDAPAKAVKAQLRKVEAYDRDFPGPTRERAKSHILGKEMVEQRERRVKRILLAAAVALVASLMALIAWKTVETKKRNEVAAQIAQHAARKDFAGGHALIDRLGQESPQILKDAKVAQAVWELREREAAETRRRSQLSTHGHKFAHSFSLSFSAV